MSAFDDLMALDGWADRECLGVPTGVFFPPDGNGRPGPETVAKIERAKAICDSCPVITACREAALEVPVSEDFGVWGGLTAFERRSIRRRRLAVAS